MRRRIAIFCALTALAAGVAVAVVPRAGGWTRFQLPAGGCEVLMPGPAQAQATDDAVLPTLLYTATTPSFACQLAKMDLFAPTPAARAAEQLDRIRDGILKLVEGRLTRESPLTLAGVYPGREVVYDVPGRRVYGRARLYLVGASLYHVQVTAASPDLDRPAFERFFDSFRVTDPPAAAKWSSRLPPETWVDTAGSALP